MIKVLSIIGTRPEAIKMAPVIRALADRGGSFTSRVCLTGQHREIVDQVLDVWGIDVHHDLAVMRPGQSLSHTAAAVMKGLAGVLEAEEPDWVLVQGDTTTAMSGALAAFHHGVPVGHVEAGLRTYDMSRPFPEEANRRIIGLLASRHFAPTKEAARHLMREAVPPAKILVTGNTVIDAFHHTAAQHLDVSGGPLAGVDTSGRRRVVLVTCHRRENFGAGVVAICEALRELAHERPDVQFVLPVHPNPQVRDVVTAVLGHVENVLLTPPLEYQPLVWLLERCSFLITDSGGLQEEATAVGRPVLVLRTSTERPEGVLAGTATLVGADRDRILHAARALLDDPEVYERMSRRTHPYGDGTAATQIVEHLRSVDVVGLSPLDMHAYEGAALPLVAAYATSD